jgi:hypothetical protein
MRLSKKAVLIFAVLLVTCALSDFPALAQERDEEQLPEDTNWWDNWYRDENHNKIDDLIEDMTRNDEFGIFINYDIHPEEEDVERLSGFDIDVKYVYQYIDVICARNVDISEVEAISNLPHVVMVKLEPTISPNLDISTRALKARESDEYSPQTAHDLGFLGGDETFRPSIAVLDSGVDDGGLFPNQRHSSLDDLDDDQSTNDPKRRAGVDFTQDESFMVPRDGSYDPDDVDGHGTHCGKACGCKDNRKLRNCQCG